MAPSLPPKRLIARADALALFAPIARLDHEVAALAFLGPERSILGLHHIAGGVDRVSVSIRAIARTALALDAGALMIAHNHPDGDATPSAADRAFTRRLVLALSALEIETVDHLVLAGGAVTSFRDLGWL